MDEAAKWLARVASFLPQIIGLWKAAEADDEQAQLEASLDLVQAMKRQQATERFG